MPSIKNFFHISFRFCSFYLHTKNIFYSVELTIMSLMGPSDTETKMKTLGEIKLPSSLFISGITLIIDRPFECEEIETGN